MCFDAIEFPLFSLRPSMQIDFSICNIFTVKVKCLVEDIYKIIRNIVRKFLILSHIILRMIDYVSKNIFLSLLMFFN